MLDAPPSRKSLPGELDALWRRQLTEWPRLRAGVDALSQARTRHFDIRGWRVMAQNNPARATSTAAKVDAASLAARPCFLCAGNQPAEQRGLMYGDQWRLLCNPAPLFDPHFTIVHRDHVPQLIVPFINPLLQLARDLAGFYTVFYNGPFSGASAPDHAHFQASPVGATPFESELAGELCHDHRSNDHRWIEWLHQGNVRVGATRPSHRPALVLMGAELDAVAEHLRELLAVLAKFTPAEPEPMLNLFATFTDDRWLVWLHPRRAHRPAFYGQGPDQFLISPGAVDLAGVIITPRAEDFDRLDAGIVEKVYQQVLIGPAEFAAVRDQLRQM